MKKFIVLICCLLLLCSCQEKQPSTDAEKFAKEYSLNDKENIFVYRTGEEIINILEKGTGVVFLGFPECKWCCYYVKLLNETLKETGLEKIYYYNISDDRKNNTDTYQKIIKLLENDIQYDEEGKERIFVPDVTFVLNGEIIFRDYETSKNTKGYKEPKDYWENEGTDVLTNKFKEYGKQIVDYLVSCSSCTISK